MTVNNTGLKTAAIWARVSTKGQKEISPDTQINHCRKLLQSKGYIATKIFNIDFCSLDLSVSKEFQQLQHMIQTHEIDAVACYDRDRLMADGIDRLVFLSQLKEAGVELLICNGAPIMDTDEGQIVELALALGKKRSVLRARTGSRDGLRDRVTLKNKPANHRKVFGFDWVKDAEELIPNADYGTVKMIFDLALSGNGYDKIATVLAQKGIQSPKGSTWDNGVISSLLHNSVYAGRFAALKTTTVRNSDRPGRQVKRVPESQWVFLPGVIIEQPIITWEQRTQLFEQIQKRINFSKRHANFDYLLRSMIECEEHIGSKGKHLKYRGCPLHGSYGYACDGGDEHSRHHFIQGPKIEEAVKKAFRELFASPLTAGTLWENISNLDKINKPELEAELKKLQSKLSKAYQNEAKLEESRINGLKSEVWELLNTKFQVQRKALEEGIRETQNLLDSASANEVKAASWKEIKDRFIVGSNKFTQTQWRNLLEEVSCRILVISSQNADWSQILESFDKTSEIPRKLKMESEYHAAITFLHDFDAIMFLKAPYQVQPQKVADIGLSMA